MVGLYCGVFCWAACFSSLVLGLAIGEDLFIAGWEVVRCSGGSYSIELFFDQVGFVFSGVVFLISGCVFNFSKFYMGDEPFKSRFHSLLMCFVGSMVLFIFIPNLFGLMLGWDGLGIFSFLLIIFYPASSSLAAGFLTALTNRLGDCFIILTIFFMGAGVGSTSCLGEGLGVCGFLLAFGAMTKSAQYPFCAWLPQAMAAPTPVSSLVHSSTLVTAGVFLMIRYFEGLSSGALSLLQWSSLLTLVVAGVAACLEYDLKKIVALSTLSQVSLMMFAVSVGFPALAFFHLICHAVTKALLFICVGLIIKGYGQDLRRVGSCFPESPDVKNYFAVSCFSLCGFPFFSGFYSKELILEGLFMSNTTILAGGMFMVGVLTTGFYCARLFYYCFIRGLFNSRLNGGTMGLRMGGCSLPSLHGSCFPLFMCSMVLGGLGSWFHFSIPCLYPAGEMKLAFLSIPFWGVWWFWVVDVATFSLYRSVIESLEIGLTEEKKQNICRDAFFRELGFLDGVSSQPFVYWGMVLSEEVNKVLEQGWLEFCGPKGFSKVFKDFLNANYMVCGHWYNTYIITYVGFIIFWVLGS